MILKFICFVNLLSVVVATNTARQLKWQNCDDTAPVLIKNLTILPYPISLEEGVKLRVSGVVNLKYTVSLKIERKFLAWWPTLPCIKSVGSCEYHIGEKKIPTQTIDVPDITVPAFITDGTYRVNADVKEDGTGNRLFCINLEFELDS
ncbi:ganglioside GM2 activator-like [Dendronephthya gigantea]|uniref:ganglioside GM2 activator-like n=1 Tax=Dendronephthya gigantea TaxID=151771 RepID=UPI00106CB4BE|nr:ganglioside GM2 activator-like [Dendronephthya gigantea]